MKMRRLLVLYLLAGNVFFGAAEAPAAKPDSKFRCTVTSSGLIFPPYDTLKSDPVTTSGSITISCNIPPPDPPVLVTLSLSAGNSGSSGQRQMENAAGVPLYYNIYTDQNFATILGDGSGQVLSNMVDKSTPWNVNVYGKIPPLQKVSVGSYSDSLTATINW